MVGDCHGCNFKIGRRQWHALLFQAGAECAAEKGGLGVKADDIDRGQQDIFEVVQVMVGTIAFPGAVNDLGNGGGGDVLMALLDRCDCS